MKEQKTKTCVITGSEYEEFPCKCGKEFHRIVGMGACSTCGEPVCCDECCSPVQ